MRFFIFLAILLSLSAPSFAETSLTKKSAELDKIEEKMAAEKSNQEKLKAEQSKLEKDMKGIKGSLISTTAKVQKHENNMRDLENRLAEVGQQKDALRTSLLKDKRKLADLILALERIRRLPPETLVARPDAPLETAQAVTVLSSLLPEINRRADKLKQNLDKLQSLEDQLKADQLALLDTTKKLKSEQGRMNDLIKERSKSLEETRKAVSTQEAKIASLAREARNFRDLIEAIQKKQTEEARRKKAAKPSHKKSDGDAIMDASLPALGTGQPPVSGIIKTRFGQNDSIGARSQGITFQSRPGAVVVAPLGGIVRYAGEFRNYGQIVLLEHKNKFHSLVAGLGKIDTFVGQHIDAGEPLGSLPGDSDRLYYELRYQGDPVNPSQKFKNLN